MLSNCHECEGQKNCNVINEQPVYSVFQDETRFEEITFTITATMKKRWAIQFLSMLQYMENLGQNGSTRRVTFHCDGDGDFRPTFVSNINLPVVDPVQDDNGDRLYDAG